MKLKRRKFIYSGASLLAYLFFNSKKGLFAKNAMEYQMKTLRGNSGIFIERGGTIAWNISLDGIVIVDSQFPEQANHLIEEIRKKSDKRINYLINTHHHGDHTAGNIAFKSIADAVVAHENSKKNQINTAKSRGNEDEQLYPDIVFKDSWSTKVGDEVITATYFGPAHTDGDAVIHFENDNVVHVGDLVFNRRFPYVDTSAGASIINWIRVLELIKKKYDEDTIFVFGHANDNYDVTGSRDDLSAMANYLSRVIELVEKELKAGMSEEDILTNTYIPGAEEWTGSGIGTSLSAAIKELSE